jgi:hypothetical protein
MSTLKPIANEQSPSVDRWVARASSLHRAEQAQNGISRAFRPRKVSGEHQRTVNFRMKSVDSGEPRWNRTINPQIKSRSKRAK